jgi:hypothetical protein
MMEGQAIRPSGPWPYKCQQGNKPNHQTSQRDTSGSSWSGVLPLGSPICVRALHAGALWLDDLLLLLLLLLLVVVLLLLLLLVLLLLLLLLARLLPPLLLLLLLLLLPGLLLLLPPVAIHPPAPASPPPTAPPTPLCPPPSATTTPPAPATPSPASLAYPQHKCLMSSPVLRWQCIPESPDGLQLLLLLGPPPLRRAFKLPLMHLDFEV